MALPRLQLRRGAGTPSGVVTPLLGEPFFDTTNNVFFIADGTGNTDYAKISSEANTLLVEEFLTAAATTTTGGELTILAGTTAGGGSTVITIPDNQTQSTTYTLPATPSAGNFLTTDGAGVLTWGTPAGGFSNFTVDDGTTSDVINSGDVLSIAGGTGITSALSGAGGTTPDITLSLTGSGSLTTNAVLAWDGTQLVNSPVSHDGSGTTTVDDNLIVVGDFTVQGTTTVNESTTVVIQDSLIELGLVDNGTTLVAPSTSTSLDLGHKFHWYDTQARLAGVYFDRSTQQIVFASDLSETSGVLTTAQAAHAPIVADSLVLSNTSSASVTYLGHQAANTEYTGQAAGTYLQNITLDFGVYA